MSEHEQQTTARRGWRISRTAICLVFILQNTLMASMPGMERLIQGVLYALALSAMFMLIIAFIIQPWKAFRGSTNRNTETAAVVKLERKK